jgi:hypothetical protein
VFAVLVSIGLLALTLQHVALGLSPTSLGMAYAQLAADPFHPNPANPVAHRILVPLISYLIGFRGRYILATNLLSVVVFLALVHLWFRARGLGQWHSLAGTATMAFSTAVLTTLHYGGYPDTSMYVLLFLAMWASRRPWLSCAMFLLALLSHESASFLAPWLFLVIALADPGGTPRWRAAATGIAAALAAFACTRWWMGYVHPTPEFSLHYYLAPLRADPLHWFRASAPHRWLGVLSAFNLFWLFPLLAAAYRLRRREWAAALVLLLPIPLALMQLFIAYDVTRIATLAFVSVLLGVADLVETDAFAARRWLPWVVAAGCFIPQLNVAMGIVDHMARK